MPVQMTRVACPDQDPSGAVRLESIILANPILAPILERWSAISLPDCWLAAGALAQTVWNDAFGLAAPDHGLKDVIIALAHRNDAPMARASATFEGGPP
jgi:hypothetical protein